MLKHSFIVFILFSALKVTAVAQQQTSQQQDNAAEIAATRLLKQQQAIEQQKLQSSIPLPQDENTTKALEDGTLVFGHTLFTGRFATQQFVGFNPDYEIASGDKIALQMWGGYEVQLMLTVDAQGNIFLPKVGPVLVRGVKNKDVNQHIVSAVGKTFKSNVGVYASLLGAEPVKVFVTGFVRKPGLYAGHSSDSILRFIDLAGGIDPKRGSFIDIEVRRSGKTIHTANLYDFLLTGDLPTFQIFDGDSILLKPVGPQISVMGLARNPFIFEFDRPEILVSDVLALAGPSSKATHVRVNRNNRPKQEVEYYALNEIADLTVTKGDVIEITADKLPGTIAVRVEGEHLSSKEHILPYGATLADLIDRIQMGDNAVPSALQLYRESNKLRQKEMLMSNLRALESSLLTARSATVEEAALRTQEAQMVLQWVERAKQIEPKGQVVLGEAAKYEQILLEADDLIVIPTRSNLVHVHGDVMFPTSMTFDDERTPKDYIELAGGFIQGSGGASTVLILHQDGTFNRVAKVDSRKVEIAPGDEIIVLPKVQTKYLQTTKDITQVLYQIAVSAGVLLRL